jgi:hypothetical protein
MKGKISRDTTSDGYAYFTKRTLLRRAHAAGKKAAGAAMDEMGYVVVAENGWVIKKYADGRIENISRIAQEVRSNDIQLD